MAQAIITDKPAGKTKNIKTSSYPISNITTKKYPRKVVINEDLPFRVRFTNITIPGYSSTNIPGIGLQIIGYNNYIL